MALFWQPSSQEIEDAGITKFIRFANTRHALRMQDFWDLHKWSTGSPGEINDFWTAIWDWTGIIGTRGPAPLFDSSVPMYDTSRFMRHAQVNWAENMLLSHGSARSKTKVAIISCVEPAGKEVEIRFIRSLTYDKLYVEVAQAAGSLRELGVGPGDRIAALTSNNAGMGMRSSHLRLRKVSPWLSR